MFKNKHSLTFSFPIRMPFILFLVFWHWLELYAAVAKSLQLCPTLCDPIDGSPPGSPVPGILQARILEWAAISSSNAWKWKVKVKSLSRVWLVATPWTAAYQAPLSTGFSRQGHWSGCHCLLWELYNWLQMLNGSGESEHLDLFLNLGRKMFSLALSMRLAIGFPDDFIRWGSFLPKFLRVLVRKRYRILNSAFFLNPLIWSCFI